MTRVLGIESESARSTILFVDDDPGILEYVGGVLEECGYAVLTGSNAASALVMLRNSDPIDLLFTDLAMPGTRWHRIGVSSPRRSSPSQSAVHYRLLDRSGPKGHLLKKPYRPQQLAGAIAAALAR